MDAIYYLHKNKELICKPYDGNTVADIRDSDFATSMWFLDTRDRETAWGILVEALSLGANKSRILELAEKWKCSEEDADVYAERLYLVLKMDGNKWCCHHINFRDLQASEAGFGDTKLEAMADLCSGIGYKGGKMWSASFKDLLRR